MSAKNYILSFLFIVFTFIGKSQEAVLCSTQIDYVKIENSENIPTVTTNSDGTVTITHQDQNITDTFAAYTVYDFYQAFPNSTGVLSKYYNIVHQNRTLINELKNTVSPDIFYFDYDYTFTSVSSNIINLLDGKVYKLIKYCSDIPEVGESCQHNEQNVPEGFDLKITFDYDSTKDIMHAETIELSPCGNSFSIDLRGGSEECCYSMDIALQLWESDLGVFTETDYNSGPCHSIEQWLYSMLDIGCQGYDYYVGNIKIYPINESGQIILERQTGIFSTDFMTFQEDNLSIEETTLAEIKIFENHNFLNISNKNNDLLTIEIFNTSGQQILKPRHFENNTINTSSFSNGLYFIKLTNLNNQQRVFKFLKN